MKKTGTAFRTAGTLAATAALTLALSGCTGPDTTAPSAVRARPATDVQAARFGAVDCREVKCIALTFDAGPSENSARLLDILKEKPERPNEEIERLTGRRPTLMRPP